MTFLKLEIRYILIFLCLKINLLIIKIFPTKIDEIVTSPSSSCKKVHKNKESKDGW